MAGSSSSISQAELIHAAKMINILAKKQVIPLDPPPPRAILRKLVQEGMTCKNTPGNYKNINTCVKNTPLRTSQITDAISKFSKRHARFSYLGTVPLDFQQINPSLANPTISLNRRYGIVFNTDPSTKSGTHWIAAFIDGPAKMVCFFDSLGKKPPAPIAKWIKTICAKYGFKFVQNKSLHQLGNSECGVYCIYFIEQKLNGMDISNIQILDHEMSGLRRKYGLDI